MKTRIKVQLEYWGHFQTETSEDYKIVKITGAPTVDIRSNGSYFAARVGDLINEQVAAELATRTDVTTNPKTH